MVYSWPGHWRPERHRVEDWDDARDDVASADNNRGLDDDGNPTGEDPRFA